MKKIIFVSVLLLGIVWWLAGFFWSSQPDETVADETVVVTRGAIAQWVESTATITPENRLEIKPPIAGRAVSVEVDLGAKVKQGQVLAWMSSEERAALLDAARAKGPEEIKFWEDVYKPAPLVAPLDGEIISRTLVPGQVVQANDVAFVMSDRLIARADMDETDLAKIHLQQRVQVVLDSYPGEKIEGWVHKIAYDSETNNSVTTYAVDVVLADIPEVVRSGMTASVSFLVAARENVLLLPVDAVGADAQVLVVGGGKEVKQKIEVGMSDGKMVEVISGLQEGQRVVRASYALPSGPKQGMTLIPMPGARGGSGGGGGPPPP